MERLREKLNLVREKLTKSPASKIPQFPEKLPGTFWGITAFFNPAKYCNKIENYRKFRESSKKQGLNLLAVEFAFDQEPFELSKEDADILIQIRGGDVLWQKERLLNVGLENLPEDCDKVAWLDCDIIFEDNNWVKETSKLLEKYIVMQPFSFCVRLPWSGVIDEVKSLPFGNEEAQRFYSAAYANINPPVKDEMAEYLKYGHPGFSWAIRKSVIDKAKFYDRNALGFADVITAHALCGLELNSDWVNCSEALKKDLKKWFFMLKKEVKGSVFFVEGILFHLWHGDHKNRTHGQISGLTRKYNFDPKEDIGIDKNKALVWTSDKNELHREIEDYFFDRKESPRGRIPFISQVPQKLPGTFWGITAFFNPAKYCNKIENYRIFKESIKKQGLKFVCVELAFGNEPFELSEEDADILVQVRSKSILWQKERLLNIGLKHLPEDCDKVAWLDADIIFEDNNWIKKSKELLEKYAVIQLFSLSVNLPEGEKNPCDKIPKKFLFSYGFGKISPGFNYSLAFWGDNKLKRKGNPGHAWAIRRDIIEECGFFDKGILGSGDDIMAGAFIGSSLYDDAQGFNDELKKSRDIWANKIFSLTKGSSFYMDNTVFHLWHGNKKNRFYIRRYNTIKKLIFDPEKDLKINEWGCWEWNTKEELLKDEVKKYFLKRQEETNKPFFVDEAEKESIFFSIYNNFQMHGGAAIPEKHSEFLYSFLRNNNIKKTIETGFATGASSACIIAATGRTHVAIDPFEGSAYKNIGIENLRKLGFLEYLRLYREPPFSALPKMLENGDSFDFAFKNKISIIIPCYNDGVYLKEAVGSVLECDKNLYEIIIVDDGSTDEETIKIINELEKNGIKICRTPHKGQSVARNEGAKISKHPYLLFLDADNKITQELLEKGIDILDKDPLIGIVYSDYIQFGALNNIIRQKDFEINRAFFLECSVDTCAVIRREVFDDCLGFDKNMDFWEDWEFSINAHKNGWKFFHIPKALYYYRIKGNSVNAKSKIKEKRIKILEYVLKKHFDLVPEAMDSKSVLRQEQSNKQILSELAQEKSKNLELETYIENIKRSLTWKMLCAYNKVLDFLLPEKSFFRKFYNQLIIYNQKLINKKRDSLAKKNIFSENFWQEFYVNNFKPDVVFINHEESLTGAPKVLFKVAKIISSRFDIAIISNKSGSMSHDFLKEFGHKVIHPNQIYFNTSKDHIAKDILLNLNPKVVYLNTIVNLEYAREAKKLNIPVIIHVHELKEVFSIYLNKKEIEDVKNLGNIFIAPSLAVKDYLISIGCQAEKIIILNEMIDIDEIIKKKVKNKDDVTSEIGKRDGQILVSASGTLTKRKGPDLFFEAYMILKNKYPGRFRFFWLGGAHTDPKVFFEGNQEEDFLFLGEKKNPYPFINESDIFVLPSREDPFPLVVLEAISMGKPVVAFKESGGAREVIKKCGILAESFNPESLAEKIEFLSSNLNLRQKMSDIAKKEALKYDSKILYEKTNSIISNFFDKEVYKVKKNFNKGKKVSVIVPSFNYEEFLPQALDSIISQTYKNWEIIVVDDNSTDSSIDIINNYIKRYPDKIKLIVKKAEEKGLGFSYKIGVKASSGEYIAFLEADDIWLEDNLEKRMKIFDNYKEVVCVFGNAKIFGEERAVKNREKNVIFHFRDINIPKQSPFYFGDQIKKKIPVRTFSATVVKKDALRDIKFSNDFFTWFDWWFHAQLSSKGKYFYIPEKNTLWRVHGDNYTSKFSEEDSWREKFLEVKKKIELFLFFL